MVSTDCILFFRTSVPFFFFPLPRWVVGYLLLVRRQQAAICWPAGGRGSERLGVVGTSLPPSLHSAAGQYHSGCVHSQGAASLQCAVSTARFYLLARVPGLISDPSCVL